MGALKGRKGKEKSFNYIIISKKKKKRQDDHEFKVSLGFIFRGWREDSADKNTCGSSLHLLVTSQPSVTPVPGDLTLSSDFLGHYSYR